jgi:hypothetical protein
LQEVTGGQFIEAGPQLVIHGGLSMGKTLSEIRSLSTEEEKRGIELAENGSVPTTQPMANKRIRPHMTSYLF